MVAPFDVNMTYEKLVNGSIFSAVNDSYAGVWGPWLWVVIYVATLGLVVIRTQNPALTALVVIIGNTGLYYLIPPQAAIAFYTILILSVGLVLYMFFGSPKTY